MTPPNKKMGMSQRVEEGGQMLSVVKMESKTLLQTLRQRSEGPF